MRNFVTDQECRSIIEFASSKNMEAGQTEESYTVAATATRKKSFVTWLEMNDNKGLIGHLAGAIRNMMLDNTLSLACEPMQVVRYDPGGEYKFHHDGNNRLLTVLYYINGEGETWFPLAEADTGGNGPSSSPPKTRQEALDATVGLIPGQDGILVSTSLSQSSLASSVSTVKRGDAVAFYSYHKDGTMDWKAIHAGMPAQQEKYIANHFIRFIPPSSQQKSTSCGMNK